MWQYVIPAVAGIVVAVIECVAQTDRKKATRDREEAKAYRQKQDERAELREKEMRLSMNLVSSSASLGLINSTAIVHGKLNGNVEEAMEQVKQAQKEYYDFINGIATHEMSKGA